MAKCASLLSALLTACSTEAEADILKCLQRELTAASLPGGAVYDSSGDGSLPRISNVFQEQTQFQSFVCYVFTRRFGWSENMAMKKRKDASESVKVTINDCTDDFIVWLLQEELSELVLNGLTYTIQQANCQPVVRHQSVIHLMDWVITASNSEISPHLLNAVICAVLLALTDVWSAIRNTCVSRLNRLMDLFSLDQLREFFEHLVQICNDSERSWQAKEGAIAGINAVIRRFQWVTVLPPSSWQGIQEAATDRSELHSQPEYFLRFGATEELTSLPCFITEFMQHDIFLLLSHPQLSIRENSIKAFSSYITRADFKEALTSLKSVVHQLQEGTLESDHVVWVPSTEEEQEGAGRFMDAYKAEGFLGVCVNLVKHIAPCYLLPDWPMYFSTFSAYLKHPASTVRQSTSTIFKFIVAKGSSSPSILRLVLQGLSSGWNPDEAYLEQQTLTASTLEQLSGSFSMQATPSSYAASGCCESWQWREGRLLAYELLCQFLIKNHWLYTFGSSSEFSSCNQAISPRGKKGLLTSSANEADLTHNRRNRSCSGSSQHAAVCSSVSSDMKQRTNRLSHHGSQNEAESRKRCNSYSSKTSPLAIPGVPNVNFGGNKFSSSAGAAEISSQTNRGTHSRLATMSDYSASPPLQALMRHYSYYKDGNTTQKSASRPQLSSDTMSLLLHTLALEQQQPETELPSDLAQVAAAWISDLRLKSFSQILPLILRQTVESLADCRWEVRRMGQQLFPCLVEVFLWFDVRLLQDLWKRICGESSLMTYAACWSLQISLQLAANLQGNISSSMASERDQLRMKQILLTLNASLAPLLQHLITIIARDDCDKLSIVAMHGLILAHTHFMPSSSSSPNSVHSQLSTLFSQWIRIGRAAHSADFPSHLSFSPSSSPNESLFSHFSAPSGEATAASQLAAQQVEKQLLTAVLGSMPAHLKVTPLVLAARILPLLVSYLRYYCEMDNMVKALLECVHVVVAQRLLPSASEDQEERAAIEAACRSALCQFSLLVKSKNVDVGTMRQSLDMCCLLLVSLPAPSACPAGCIQTLLTAISHRAAQIGQCPVTVRDKRDPAVLAANHVTVFDASADLNDGMDSEEDDEAMEAAESVLKKSALNLMNLSAGSLRRDDASCKLDEEELGGVGEGSDWDDSDHDWSSDEDAAEDSSAVRRVFSEFLTAFKSRAESRNTSFFNDQLQLLKPAEQKEISLLLTLK